MNPHDFEAQLQADGFTDIETKHLEAKPANGHHGHHYDVRGVVLAGQFIVTHGETPVAYNSGDVFRVAAGDLHCEATGAEGASILVGRKY